MNGILNIGKSGLQSFQNKVEIISNNIANTSTAGYKKLDQSFQELMRKEIGERGTPLSDKMDQHIPTIGSGARSSDPFRVFEQGSIIDAGDTTQLAIEGNGFFGVENADGDLLLTRSIKFSVDGEDGRLVDQNGYVIQLDDDDDFEDIAATDLSVGENGEILNEEGKSMGRIILYEAENRDALLDAGGGYFSVPKGVDTEESDGDDDSEYFGKIKQSFVEMSNVNIGEELVDLIVAQRAYQFNSKSIQAADEMWQAANNLRR